MTKVCVLAAEATLQKWQAAALQHLLEHADVDVTTVVYNEYENTRTRWETVKRGIELREWTAATLFNQQIRYPIPQTNRVPIDSVLDIDTARELSVMPTFVDGWKQKIPAETVETIAEDADVGIRFGFGFLVGPILSELEYGVLSYHHGDLREYRGQPMGFWEFVNDEDVAGITVQQLSTELDAGQIAAIKSVPIDDLYTWEAIKQRLFAESDDMLTTAVQTVRNGREWEPESLGERYTLPRGYPVLEFTVKNTTGRLRELL